MAPVPDPRGRVDLLLMRLAEGLTRVVEQKTGLSIWDGEDGLSGVMQDKMRELKVPTKPLNMDGGVSVRTLAEQIGFLQKRRERRLRK